MSYFNPKVYNYSNLNKEDREHFFWMLYMYETVLNFKGLYSDNDKNSSVLEKMYDEIESEVVENIENEMRGNLIDFIVTRIDDYDHDVEEIDTDDHFYGLRK